MFQLFCVTIFASQFRYFNIGGLQVTFVRIFLLALIVTDLIKNHGKLRINRKNNIWLIALLIWNVWNLLSYFWVQDKTALLRTETILFEALALIYYAQRLIDTKERAATVLYALLIPCVIHNVLGWLEVTRKIYLFSKYTELYSRLGYPVSSFTNTNNYGLYMAMMCIIMMGIISVTTKRFLRIGCVALLASSMILLFRTGSRGAIIAILVSVVLFTLLLRKSLKLSIILGAVLLGTVILMVIKPNLFQSLENIYQSAFRVNLDAVSGSDYYRIHMLQNGMDFLDSTYGLGVGAGNVEHWMKNYGTRFTDNVNNIHNWWVEILVGSGVLVFAAVLYAWFSTYRKMITAYISGFNRNVLSALISFGVVFAIGCIAPSTLFMAEWPWFLLGLFFYFTENPMLLSRSRETLIGEPEYSSPSEEMPLTESKKQTYGTTA